MELNVKLWINLKINDMWIARDDNGDLNLFRIKPYKSSGYWIADANEPQNHKMRIDRDLFPEIKSYSQPVEVEVIIKKK